MQYATIVSPLRAGASIVSPQVIPPSSSYGGMLRGLPAASFLRCAQAPWSASAV